MEVESKDKVASSIKKLSKSSFDMFSLFYIFMNIFTFTCISYFSDNFFSNSILILSVLFLTAFLSIILFFTVRRNPGLLNSEIDSSLIQATEIKLDEENQFTVNLSSDSIINISNIKNSEIDICNTKLIIRKLDSFMKSCEFCQIKNKLRSKHCRRCGHCVRKFDHHCFLVGGCIGEENHFKFLLYLLFQSISIGISLSYVFSIISNFLDKFNDKYSKVPFAIYINLVYLLVYFLLVSVLFLFHCYLISTNQTTYEIYYREKNEHLRLFDDLKKQRNSLAFDQGVVKNIKIAYKASNTDWKQVLIENLNRKEERFNFCQNKYYSCF